MNESFFGQYSVFAVFGSVVGCVVVPLIAQVLQQQSMECMILSAIVLSLTAAHLNKKGVNEKDCSKILLNKELERKKLNHSTNNNKKHKHHTSHSQHPHSNNNNNINNGSHQYLQQEQEYMQQHEHLKVAEMEKRSEEKRLKKIRKREERRQKREEENKKQKELEERYRTLKDKRMRYKENLYKTNNSYNSSVYCFEKYCQPTENNDRRQHGLSTVDESTPRRQSPYVSNSHRIPRFERTRTASVENASKYSQHSANRSISGSLTIGCSSLSASCSSLSSISSSGSASPPLPASPPPCNNNVWKPSSFNSLDISPDNAPVSQSSWLQTDTVVPPCQLAERGMKSYSSSRQTKSKVSSTYGFDSSSLFCSQDQTKNRPSEQTGLFSGEYSLFGPQKFSNVLPKPTVM